MGPLDVLIGLVTGRYTRWHHVKCWMLSLLKVEKSSLPKGWVNTRFMGLMTTAYS